MPRECSLSFEGGKTVRKGGVWRQTSQNSSAVGGESRGPSILCTARLDGKLKTNTKRHVHLRDVNVSNV